MPTLSNNTRRAGQIADELRALVSSGSTPPVCGAVNQLLKEAVALGLLGDPEYAAIRADLSRLEYPGAVASERFDWGHVEDPDQAVFSRIARRVVPQIMQGYGAAQSEMFWCAALHKAVEALADKLADELPDVVPDRLYALPSVDKGDAPVGLVQINVEGNANFNSTNNSWETNVQINQTNENVRDVNNAMSEKGDVIQAVGTRNMIQAKPRKDSFWGTFWSKIKACWKWLVP